MASYLFTSNKKGFGPYTNLQSIICCVFAIKNPDINFDLLNKFLVLCEYNNIEVMLKNELLDDDAAEVLEEKFLTDDSKEETVEAITNEVEEETEENA